MNEEKIEKAWEEIHKGKITDGINILNEVLLHSPNDWEVYYYLGQAYRIYGNIDKAIEFYEKAKSLDNDGNLWNYLGLAKAYSMKNDFEKAMVYLRNVFSSSKLKTEDILEIIYAIGADFLKNNQFNFANEIFEEVNKMLFEVFFTKLRMSKNYIQNYFLIEGNERVLDSDKVNIEFDVFLKNNSLCCQIKYNLGVCRANLGDLQGATEAFNESIKFTPIGLDFQSPIIALKEIEDMTNKNKLDVALRLIDSGQPENAITILKELKEETPNDSNIYYLLGYSYREANKFKLAEENYKKSIKIAPKQYASFFGLGITYQKQSKFRKALKYIKKAININQYYVNAYNSLGYTYKLKGDAKKAIESYSKGINVLFDNIYDHILNNQEFIDEEIVAEKFNAEMWFETAMKIITQYARKDGFEKIRFPTPETVVELKENNPYGSKLFIDDGNIRTILPNMLNNFANKLSGNIAYANLLNNLGVIYVQLNKKDLARDYFIEAIIFTPEDVEFPLPLYHLKEID